MVLLAAVRLDVLLASPRSTSRTSFSQRGERDPSAPTSDFARSILSPNSFIWFSIRFIGMWIRLISNRTEEDDNSAHFSADEVEPSIDI